MKIRIEDITLREYIGLPPAKRVQYDLAIEYGKFDEQKDVYRMGDITKRTFGFVKDIQQLYESDGMDNIDFFNALNNALIEELDITDEGVYSTSCFDYFNFIKFLSESIKRINKIERSLIVMEVTDTSKPSGKRFDKYGYMIQIDHLAGGDILKYDEVKKIPYEIAFTKMMLEKDRAEYNNEYQERLKRKYKTHGQYSK